VLSGRPSLGLGGKVFSLSPLVHRSSEVLNNNRQDIPGCRANESDHRNLHGCRRLLAPARFRRTEALAVSDQQPKPSPCHTIRAKGQEYRGGGGLAQFPNGTMMNVSLSKPTIWCKCRRQRQAPDYYLQSCMDGNSGWLLPLNKGWAQ
jgi:hypothetical protein